MGTAGSAASARPATDLVAAGLIRGLRRTLGLTQTQMADLAGVRQSVISAYETGARQPSLGALVRLVEAAGHELRLNVVPRDRHDELLAASTPPEELEAFRRQQTAYATRRQAEVIVDDVFADVLGDLPVPHPDSGG